MTVFINFLFKIIILTFLFYHNIFGQNSFERDEERSTVLQNIIASDIGVADLNNDGINDTWVIRGLEEYPNHKIKIFNIWNTKIFESKNYQNDWRGTNQTQIYFGDGRLPEGTYYYIFDLGNGKKPLKGFVFIKRD